MKNKNYEIVKHPLMIFGEENDQDKLNEKLYKNNDGFVYNFTDNIHSSRIYTSKTVSNYIEILIDEDNEIYIVNHYTHINEFVKPADFIIPTSEESKDFYDKFHSFITVDNLSKNSNILKYSDYLNEYLKNNDFPEIPPPKISILSKPSKLKDFKIFDSLSNNDDEDNKNDKNTIESEKRDKNSHINDENIYINKNALPKAMKCRITDEIPTKMPEGYYKIYNNIFNDKISYGNLIGDLEKLKKKNLFKSINLPQLITDLDLKNEKYTLRSFLPLYFYYYTSGPWKDYWVKYGYDLRKDPSNFVFQNLNFKKKGIKIILNKHPKILKEIKKNQEWYILKEFDNKKGFISKAVWDLIEFVIGSSNELENREEVNEYSDKLNESEDFSNKDLDFEIFD